MKVKLSKEQEKVINTIYNYFKQNNEWVGTTTLHLKLDKNLLNKVMQMKPLLIWKTNDIYREGNPEIYKLLPLGLLICLFKDDENKKILFDYLKFLVRKFKENPEHKTLQSSEIKLVLNLPEDKLLQLREIIKGLNLYSEATWAKNGTWEVSFPRDIEKLVELNDPEKYLQERIEDEIQKEQIFQRRKIINKAKSLICSPLIKKILIGIISTALGSLFYYLIVKYLIK